MRTQSSQYRAWLIQEKKLVTVDSIHWNKGYGGALQIWVDNPEFDPVKHILERGEKDPHVDHMFTYTNHVLKAHLTRTPFQFILLQPTGFKDLDRTEIYESDVLFIEQAGPWGKMTERVVEWDEKSGRFMLNCINHQELAPIHLTDTTGYRRKIRGSYYELYGTDKINNNPDNV